MKTTQHTCYRCGALIPSSGRLCAGCSKPPGARLGMPLSARERQIVERVAAAKLNKQIAWELRLTEGTIKEYLNRIFCKTGAHNRVELAVRQVRGELG